jgi:hypothetical protein
VRLADPDPDPALARFLRDAGVEPFFATSWLLTWFAHDVQDLEEIARIYDALLCSHPMFCYYLAAAVTINIFLSLLLSLYLYLYLYSYLNIYCIVCCLNEGRDHEV